MTRYIDPDDIPFDATFEEVAEAFEVDEEAFEVFCDDQHMDAHAGSEYINDFRDSYIGKFHSVRDFMEEQVIPNEYESRLEDFPSEILSHIDWKGVWESHTRFDYWSGKGHYFKYI